MNVLCFCGGTNMKQKTTTDKQCQCASKDSQLCCPADGELRENWLSTLEKEHEPLRQASKKMANNVKLLLNICIAML